MVRKDNTIVDAITNYRMSSKEDKDKHETEVKKLLYVKELNQLISIERDARRFKFFDIAKQKNKWKSRDSLLHTGTVISAEYIPKWGLLATTANDNSINFWDAEDDYAFKNRISTPEIQLCAKWNEEGPNFLYTAGCDAVIHAYDPEPESCKEVMRTDPYNVLAGEEKKCGHTAQIMDLLVLPKQSNLIFLNIINNR